MLAQHRHVVAVALVAVFLVSCERHAREATHTSATVQPRSPARPQLRVAPSEVPGTSVVPAPRWMDVRFGAYVWPTTIRVAARGASERAALFLVKNFARPHGMTSVVAATDAAHADIVVVLLRPRDPTLGTEGYELKISSAAISISANRPAGIFYGLQTLEQLTNPISRKRIATRFATVRDWPMYAWRGVHLDVSRHFFPVPVVERFIDVAAHYKLNVFHWHLTDDQAWRIEIKRRPLLTRALACTPSARNCGFYSQNDVRRIVAYARDRQVEIVPEIDVPGHSSAAIRAYPELSCNGATGADVLCPTDETFAFLDDVFAEIVTLFPGRFVHIGGDEVSTHDWRWSARVAGLMKRERLSNDAQVQGYMTTRIARSVERRGRRAIGWDEILSAPIPKSVAVMAWRGRRAVALGMQLGHDVVATPEGPLYFNGYQGDADQEPPAMRYVATMQEVYRYQVFSADVGQSKHGVIAGLQANMWTEQIATSDRLFYMLLPRELALAEDAWSPPATHVWADFRNRLPAQLTWLSHHHYAFRIPDVLFHLAGGRYQFAPIGQSVQSGSAVTALPKITVRLSAPVSGEIRYTLDGSVPTKSSRLNRGGFVLPLRIGTERNLRAAVFLGATRGPVSSCTVRRVAALRASDDGRTFPSWWALMASRRPTEYVPPRFP